MIMKTFFILLFFVNYFLVEETSAFLTSKDVFHLRQFSSSLSATATQSTGSSTPPTTSLQEFLAEKDGPDFYWKYRLERLKKKKGSAYAFDRANYPGKKTDQELYEVYYLDLVLRGKMEGFDVHEEQLVKEEEWKEIFNEMMDWTNTVHRDIPESSLPDSPFELLETFFPELRKPLLELDSPLNDPDVHYKTKKDMLEDAFRGKLTLPPGVGKEEIDITSLEQELDMIEADALQKVDALQNQMLAEIESSPILLDPPALSFYQKAKEFLQNIPITTAEIQAERTKTLQRVDEMAAFVVRAENEEHEHHHEHHEGAEQKLSVAEQFKQKYGMDLIKIRERLAKFNSDSNYLESVAMEMDGKEGLENWKEIEKTYQENYANLSETDRVNIIQNFKSFLNKL